MTVVTPAGNYSKSSDDRIDADVIFSHNVRGLISVGNALYISDSGNGVIRKLVQPELNL